jgi:tail assembly chaperone
VFVKRQSFGSIERLFLKDDDDDRSRSAAYIADTILLGDKGTEPMSYNDAYQLEPSLAKVLIEAINSVNGTGATEPKN